VTRGYKGAAAPLPADGELQKLASKHLQPKEKHGEEEKKMENSPKTKNTASNSPASPDDVYPQLPRVSAFYSQFHVMKLEF
jgi:hypothetical protein